MLTLRDGNEIQDLQVVAVTVTFCHILGVAKQSQVLASCAISFGDPLRRLYTATSLEI
jgi:hypothetical protein